MKELSENKQLGSGIVSGAVSLAISVFIVKIIGFIYKLPLSYIMHDEGMGYFNTAYTVFSFFYLLCSTGIPRAVSIMVTELGVKGQRGESGILLRSALKLFLVIGFVFCAFLVLFSKIISNSIGSPDSFFAMICIAPSIIAVCISGVLRGYLNGICALVPISVSQVLEGVIKFVFGMLFALLGVRCDLPLQMIAGLAILGVTLASMVSAIYLLIDVKMREKGENTRQNIELRQKRSYIKRVLAIAAPLTLSSAVMGFSNLIDLGIIMKRLSDIGYTETQATALYGNYTTLVVPMLNLVVALISPVTVAALPMLTGAFCLGEGDVLREKVKGLIDVTAFLAMPMCLAFIFFSEEILILLFNDESASVAAPLLILIAPSMIFIPMLTMVNTTLEAGGHTKAPLIAMSLGAAVKLLSSYLLMGNSDFGISGAPLGSTLSYAISFIAAVVLMINYTGIKPRVFASLYKPFVLSFVSVALSKFLYVHAAEGVFSPVLLFVFACVAIILYLTLSAFCGIFSRNSLKMLSKSPKKDEKY